MVAVAAVARAAIPGIGWPAAFILGAVLAPTDPTAATAIAHRLGLPRRLIVVIEGESVVNDGTALVAYRFAVAAAIAGGFSLADAAGRFVLDAVGGVVIGLVVGVVVREVRRRLDNPPVEITITLLTGYLAYLPAQVAGFSGVLAAVATGIYMAWYAPEVTTPRTRLQAVATWEVVFLLLNALIFGLVGVELPTVLEGLSHHSLGSLITSALVVTATVMGVRLAWIYCMGGFRRPRESAILGWSGMRGAVSLALALALPHTTGTGVPFADRELLIFLTFAVILGTLVAQGLTLPGLVRLLRLENDEQPEKEEAKARIRAADAALERLEELIDEDWVHEDVVDRMRGLYGFRRTRFESRLDPASDGSIESRSADYQRLRHELLDAERSALIELRRSGGIDDDVMRRVMRDLDLEEGRLDL